MVEREREEEGDPKGRGIDQANSWNWTLGQDQLSCGMKEARRIQRSFEAQLLTLTRSSCPFLPRTSCPNHLLRPPSKAAEGMCLSLGSDKGPILSGWPQLEPTCGCEPGGLGLAQHWH